MYYADSGITHLLQGKSIESTSFNGITLSLLASADGTEIIHHHLTAGKKWVLGPTEDWNALEYLFVISGSLSWKTTEGNVLIKAGDSLSMAPIKEDVMFTAETDTQFLYITSQPVFFHYSQSAKDMMELAVSVEEKDGYTADHCNRIMQLSMLVGSELQLSSNEMHNLNLGAFLHDIGKVKVPLEILNKPGKLTNEEWEIMKKHTTFGRELLQNTNNPSLISASSIVELHHERYDGSGYPFGVKGDQINIGAAIVAVVDSFDAMTTNRVYSKARTKEEALNEIVKGRGTLYHPDVVDVFLSIKNKL